MSRELVAVEGHYHKSCYRLYTKVEHSGISDNEKCKQNEEAEYEEAERITYDELFLYVRNELFPNPEILPMAYFTSRLKKCMISLGISKMKPSSKKHVRRKLESELGESLHFISNEKEKLLVYPGSLSMDDLAIKAYNTNQELQHAESVSSGDAQTKVAIQLRNQIKTQDKNHTWPPDTQQNVIPEALRQFLYSLLTGDVECVNPSGRIQRLATSFENDLVFAVTCGKTKPPKHVLLPFAVKSLTGNTELIQTLNRLGQCILLTNRGDIYSSLRP